MVDRLITLFESTDTDFSTNGIGALPDAITCTVTEERNGAYELEMTYPITGVRYNEITERRILLARPNPYASLQPFRIYAISKPMDGTVTVNAEHISYDLSGYTVSPFSASDVVSALATLKMSSDVECPFDFWTDKETSGTVNIPTPLSMRAILGGVEGSILDMYKGEYEFDGYTVKLWNARGENRGMSIRYGKNLTNFQQEENCSDVYTAVRPYWYKEKGDSDTSEEEEDYGYVELTEKIINVPGDFNFLKIMSLDLTEEFDSKPTEEELRAAAQTFINENDIAVPKVSITVSFVQIADDTMYRDVAILERVQLCDIVNIEFPKLGVSATAKCVKTSYDVLGKRYLAIELGDAKTDLTKSISIQNKTVKELPTKTDLEKAITNAANLITGQTGGYVVLNPSEHPQEILILDHPTIEEAVNVWRWNSGGLGFSSTGYNGRFDTAITMDGKIVADFILAGTMSANLIKGGMLQLGSNLNQNGSLAVYDEANNTIATIDNNGLKLYGTDGFYLIINPEEGFAGYDGRTTPPNKLFWVNEDEFHQKKAVVEDEIRLCDRMSFLPVTITDGNNVVNNGIAVVAVNG